MSKGIVNRRDKFLWDNSAKPSITDVEGGGGGTQLKSETTPHIISVRIYDDNGTWKANDFYMPDFTGHYYLVENTGEKEFPQEIITVQMYDTGDPMGTFTLDLREMPAETWNLYAFGTGETTMEYYGNEQPVVTTEYEELTLGTGLSVSGSTLNGPNLSQYGKTLVVSSNKIQLKNGNTILSEITPPAPSGVVTSGYANEINGTLDLNGDGGQTIDSIDITQISEKHFSIYENGQGKFEIQNATAGDIMDACDVGKNVRIDVVSFQATKVFRLGYYIPAEEFVDPVYSFVCIHNSEKSTTGLTIENFFLTDRSATTVTIYTKSI